MAYPGGIAEGKPVSGASALQNFLQSRSLAQLQAQPIIFEKNPKVNGYTRCWACLCGVVTGTLTTLIWPGYCCPGNMYPSHYLELNHESLKYVEVENDICCHYNKREKIVPLRDVKSTLVEGGCVLDCYGLHRLIVSNGHQEITAHVSESSVYIESKEVIQADFLADPKGAQAAIDLAVSLVRAGPVPAAPEQQYAAR